MMPSFLIRKIKKKNPSCITEKYFFWLSGSPKAEKCVTEGWILYTSEAEKGFITSSLRNHMPAMLKNWVWLYPMKVSLLSEDNFPSGRFLCVQNISWLLGRKKKYILFSSNLCGLREEQVERSSWCIWFLESLLWLWEWTEAWSL